MRPWSRLRSLWHSVAHRSDLEQQMADELQFHLERRAEDLQRHRRLSPQEARRVAGLEFGSLDKHKEDVRRNLGLRWLDELDSDLRYACRTFARNKGFTAVALATLALGIGANTAVFSVVDALLLRTLPVEAPDELVVFDWLRTSDSMVAGYWGYGRQSAVPGVGIRTSFSALTVDAFSRSSKTLADMFAFSQAGSLNVVADQQADTASGLFVSGRYFAGLGVTAALGRTLSPGDDRIGAGPVAVISHRYWQRRFSADRAIVGKTIDVNRLRVAIVGVTPEGFDGPQMTESSDITMPLGTAALLSSTGRARPVSIWWLQMMGRLKPGATREQAQAELEPIFADTVRASWAARPPETPNPSRSGMPRLRVRPGALGPDGPRLDAQDVLSVAFAVVAAVLLIGCVNLATLLLVRAAARRQEMAMRMALGASRSRVIRQWMTEILLLGVVGGSVGAVLAWWGKDFMRWFPAHETPVVDAHIDLRAFAFTTALSIGAALLFGIGPALNATRQDVAPSLKPGVGRHRARGVAGRALLAAEVALSLVLLVCAGLLLRTLHNFGKVDVGFDADNVLVFRIDPALPHDAQARVMDTYDRITAGIESVPGVRSCTMSAMPLLAGSEWEETVQPDGNRPPSDAFVQVARWNFLETMGIRLVAGRDLSASDIQGRPRVAVINQAMARQVFGVPAPLGRYFHFVDGPDRDVPIQVVGISGDARYARLAQAPPPTLVLPQAQVAPTAMTVEVRTAVDPLSVAPALRDAVRRTDPAIALAEIKTERRQIAETIAEPRAFAVLTTIAGTIGLLLACVGLYGVVSYETVRRTREIGVRLALGATRADVLRLVLRQTAIVVGVGCGVGLLLTMPASEIMGGLLFGIEPLDPVAIGSALAVLVAVSLTASFIPARRASRMDPTRALRYE